MPSDVSLCRSIRDEDHLEELLSAPTESAIRAMTQIDGDIMVLGAGGKMGPSFVRMVRRASVAAGKKRRVIAVSRFSKTEIPDQLRGLDIEVVCADLMEEGTVASLPDAQNVVSMTGTKFGTAGAASATWAINTWLPSLICSRFRNSRIMAFSTGNVYPLVSPASGGSVESDSAEPVGEYGMSALGRERIYDYFSRRFQIQTTLVRLNYAVEMRYGVLVDIGRLVQAGTPVNLSMGHANVIWQGDANALAIAALADGTCPPLVINVAGAELFSVRDVAERFAERFGTTARFVGEPQSTALLNNGTEARRRYGPSRVSLDQLIDWTADWLRRGATLYQKPTGFQVRDGKF